MRLISKEPVGSSKQVLCIGPVDFCEKRLEPLVHVPSSAAFT